MIRESLIFLLLPSIILAQAHCSNFWQYINDSGQTQGVLTLTLDNRNSEHHVQVILTVGSGLPSVSSISISNTYFQILCIKLL